MPYTFLKIKIPYDNQASPMVMEQVLSSLYSFKQKFSFEIWNDKGEIFFCFWTKQKDIFIQLLETHYTGVFITEANDITQKIDDNCLISHLQLDSCDIFPIRRYSQTTDWINRIHSDPHLSILAPLAKVKKIAGIQIVIEPTRWQNKGRDVFHISENINRWWILSRDKKRQLLKRIYKSWILRVFFMLFVNRHEYRKHQNQSIDHRGHTRESASQAVLAKLSQIGFSVTIRLISSKENGNLQSMSSGFSQFSIPEFNSFRIGKAFKNSTLIKERSFYKPFVLSLEELAGIVSLPTKEVKIPQLQRTKFRDVKKEVDGKGVLIGKTLNEKNIYLSHENFTKHIAIFGRTGSGKSTCAINILKNIVEEGSGCAVLDPHGDLIDKFIQFIPKSRLEDIVLIDPTDIEYPVALNVFHGKDIFRTTASIVDSFKSLYKSSWGARTEYFLTNTVTLLVHQSHASLLDIQKVLLDANFRRQCLQHTNDAMLHQFWHKEFLKMPIRMRKEAISSILNKVNKFLINPMMRNILGQRRNFVNFRKCIDDQRIVLVKISKGQMGEDNSKIFGNFILSLLQMAVLTRGDVSVDDRKVFHVFVDELQHFTQITDEHITTILSEGRKYGVNLIAATQYMRSVENLEQSILGNVNTLISYGLGYDDAQKISMYLDDVTIKDLINLSPYHAYLRTFRDKFYEVVSFKNIALEEKDDSEWLQQIIDLNRKKYCFPKHQVEDEIRNSLSNIPLP